MHPRVLLLLAAIASACRPTHQSPPSVQPSPIAANRTSDTIPQATSGPLGRVYSQLVDAGFERDSVRSRLGNPIVATTRTEPDPGVATARDTFVDWIYPGVAYTFLLADGDVVEEVRVDPSYKPTAWFAALVTTPAAAQRTLGPPESSYVTADTLVFQYGVQPRGEYEDLVILRFVGGRLIHIAAHPYLD